MTDLSCLADVLRMPDQGQVQLVGFVYGSPQLVEGEIQVRLDHVDMLSREAAYVRTSLLYRLQCNTWARGTIGRRVTVSAEGLSR